MEQKYFIQPSNSDLLHYGILGMKWGIRRYQNKDGSLTAAGQKRYSEALSNAMKKSATDRKVRSYDGGKINASSRDIAMLKVRQTETKAFNEMTKNELKEKQKAYDQLLKKENQLNIEFNKQLEKEFGTNRQSIEYLTAGMQRADKFFHSDETYKILEKNYNDACEKYYKAYSKAIDTFLGDLADMPVQNIETAVKYNKETGEISTPTYSEYTKARYYIN